MGKSGNYCKRYFNRDWIMKMKKENIKLLIREIVKEVFNPPVLKEINMPPPEGIVEYVKPFLGAKPFIINDPHTPQKFELCIGKLPNGKLGLAIFAYRGDLAITIDWFNELYGNLL